MPLDPSTDPRLISLKRIAEAGGERGPLHDQGVLSVITAILLEGHFVRNRMAPLVMSLNTQQGVSQKLLRADEEVEARAFLDEEGWSLEQATEFFMGVDAAEQALNVYELRGDQQATP